MNIIIMRMELELVESIDNGDEIESVNYILDGSNIIKEIHTGAK
ncbi:MAG: hypothetical protein ACLU5J_01970 [Christensenellales bacterium]